MPGTRPHVAGCFSAVPSLLLLFIFAVRTDASEASDTSDTIYRCVLADGSTSFQELPCKDRESEPVEPEAPVDAGDDDFFTFENPFDNPEPAPPENPDVPPSANRTTCERETRAKIDEIYLALEGRPSKAVAAELLEQAMNLTRDLRACKNL